MSVASVLSDFGCEIWDSPFPDMCPHWDEFGRYYLADLGPRGKWIEMFSCFSDLESKATFAIMHGDTADGGFMLGGEDGVSQPFACGYMWYEETCVMIRDYEDNCVCCWHVIDDWLWDCLLWDLNDDNSLSVPPPQVPGKVAVTNASTGEVTYMDSDWLDSKLFALGFEKAGSQVDKLEKLLES